MFEWRWKGCVTWCEGVVVDSSVTAALHVCVDSGGMRHEAWQQSRQARQTIEASVCLGERAGVCGAM